MHLLFRRKSKGKQFNTHFQELRAKQEKASRDN